MTLDQTARDARGCRALARWDDDAHAVVTTSSHGAAASVHHEAHQKPAAHEEMLSILKTLRGQSSHAVRFREQIIWAHSVP